eukprot:16394460-Heterocapsa_arctica.AAC.1
MRPLNLRVSALGNGREPSRRVILARSWFSAPFPFSAEQGWRTQPLGKHESVKWSMATLYKTAGHKPWVPHLD